LFGKIVPDKELVRTCTLPPADILTIVARGRGIKVPGDFARGYMSIDIMSSYIMEDWLQFLVYFGPVVFGDVLELALPHMAKIWRHLRAGLVYYTRGSKYSEGPISSPTRIRSREQARDNMWKAAVEMEKHCPTSMLTLNLRLVVVHLYAQEDATGAIDNTLEWWNERCIGQVSRNTPELTIAVPEVVTVNAYLLHERLDDTRSRVTCLSDMAQIDFTSHRGSGTQRKDRVKSLDRIEFLDGESGFKPVRDVLDDATLQEALRLILADSKVPGQEWTARASTSQMEISSYTRCAVSGEVFTSTEYTAVKKTASYNVVLSTAELDRESYATVSQYYHVRMSTGHATVAKLALVDVFHVDATLSSPEKGVKVLMAAESRIVRMAAILTKCIIHRCEVDSRIYAIDLIRRLSIAREHEL
jgi:hypothetical protein